MRRPERLAEALREQISEIVGYELEDPRLESVTVTEVKVADDLRDAKVYVLVEGDEKEIRTAMKALQHAATYVRQQVAMSLEIHHAPHLHFIRDTVEEKGMRIDTILSELAQNKETEEREKDE